MTQREKELLRELEHAKEIIELKDEIIQCLRDWKAFGKEVIKGYEEAKESLQMTTQNRKLLTDMLLHISAN